MKDIYNDYIKDKLYGDPYYISFDTFRNLSKEYTEYMMDRIIYHADTIKLPFRLGFLSVYKRKPKTLCSTTLSIDWEESRRYHKVIRHSNDHTGGFKYRFFWSKIKCMMVNKDFYKVIFSRTNKRLLAKAIKSGNYDYLEYEA